MTAPQSSRDRQPLRMPLRLAMRQEGANWTAYIAQTDTMDGAIQIGSISIDLVRNHPDIRDRFMAVMQDAMLAMLSHVGVKTVSAWDIIPAPAHEKAGRA